MTEPRPSCYRRCPQRTSLSGAFRSLHCLIYKVLAPSASAAERMLSYHAARLLSSSFFNFFRSSFSACRRPSAALSDSSFILPEPLEFVKLFFRSAWKFFQRLPLGLPPLSDSPFILPELPEFVKHFFHFVENLFALPPARPPRFRQLAYYTRALPVCQQLFPSFFRIF